MVYARYHDNVSIPQKERGFLQELLKNMRWPVPSGPEPGVNRSKIQPEDLPAAVVEPAKVLWYFPGDMPVACLKATQKLLPLW
jgi:hypothetical protein